MTAKVASESYESYAPTVLAPASGHVAVIEGIPPDVAERDAIQEVIVKNGLLDQEFFFGVRDGAEIIVGRHRPSLPTEFLAIARTAEGDEVRAVPSCDWWKL